MKRRRHRHCNGSHMGHEQKRPSILSITHVDMRFECTYPSTMSLWMGVGVIDCLYPVLLPPPLSLYTSCLSYSFDVELVSRARLSYCSEVCRYNWHHARAGMRGTSKLSPEMDNLLSFAGTGALDDALQAFVVESRGRL